MRVTSMVASLAPCEGRGEPFMKCLSMCVLGRFPQNLSGYRRPNLGEETPRNLSTVPFSLKSYVLCGSN